MPNITFKTKPQTIREMDGTVAYRRIKVPALSSAHYDITEFRNHPKYGALANSDLFKSVLTRALREAGVGDYIRLDRLGFGVSVDETGFLAVVTIEL